MEPLTCYNQFFVDSAGAIVLLRGVNLSGSSKIPTIPDGTTHFDQSESFSNHRNVSFVGRPFAEEQAEEHFSRLKRWGFNFLRFLVTWEALEHAGPGQYDNEYIRYLVRMVKLADKMGFYLWIDPHQDVWSRFTGGDGAPGWTLEVAGFHLQNLQHSDLCMVHHEMQEDYHTHLWFLNYFRYPVATMFTVFFAGKMLAPFLLVEGQNIQDFLQEHFIAAFTHLAKKLARFKNIVGYGSLNEPSAGYIGKENLKEAQGMGTGLRLAPTPFEEMFISEGNPHKVDIRFFYGLKGIPVAKKRLNRNAVSIWNEQKFCIWRMHGVWNYDPNGAPMLLRPDYFYKWQGKKIHFYRDSLRPFFDRFHRSISSIRKRYKLFIENEPGQKHLDWQKNNKDGSLVAVNASHWYDISLLYTKTYQPWLAIDYFSAKLIWGQKKVRQLYEKNLLEIAKISREKMENCPTVIGELGIPMDLNQKQAFMSGDDSIHEEIFDRILQIMEKHLLNLTIWNYTPDNSHALGDRWNGEDLSIYSQDTDKQASPDGGRGTSGFSRPYPMRTYGLPHNLSFDRQTAVFNYTFHRGNHKAGQAEIFVAPIHYPDGFKVIVNAGSYHYDAENYILHYRGEPGVETCGIRIRPCKK